MVAVLFTLFMAQGRSRLLLRVSPPLVLDARLSDGAGAVAAADGRDGAARVVDAGMRLAVQVVRAGEFWKQRTKKRGSRTL